MACRNHRRQWRRVVVTPDERRVSEVRQVVEGVTICVWAGPEARGVPRAVNPGEEGHSGRVLGVPADSCILRLDVVIRHLASRARIHVRLDGEQRVARVPVAPLHVDPDVCSAAV